MDNAELLKALLSAATLEDVRTSLDAFVEAHSEEVQWRPVGDRRNNSGTIQVAGDPARALLERVTNAMDAVIERAHIEHNGLPKCSSPREAVQAWFNVPSQGLHGLSAVQRRKLAQSSVVLTLLPGDGRGKRIVEVADYGTGLTAPQIPNTILSLNADNKIDKLYLAGAFGQGGSATFASADYTLITSRSVTEPTEIAFTLVKLQPPEGLKLGTYAYLTLGGNVLTTAPVEEFGAFSTRVRHFGYDLDDYPSPLGENSLYGRSQSVLFEPLLPFYFDNRVHDYRRTIKGSRTALNGASDDEETGAALSHVSPMFHTNIGEFGRLGIEYWVLERGTKSAPNKAFVSGRRPIVLTVNGQTHAEWPISHLKAKAELVHLASRMVVHLDCNELSYDAKRVLFVSNREESRRGVVQNLIVEELLNALKADPTLAKLEEEARLAGTKERDESAEKEVRREVAKMLRLAGFAVTEDAGAKADKAGDKEHPKPTKDKKPKTQEPITPNDPPSFVELLGADPLTFYPGQRRYLRIRTDALSKYHNAIDPFKSRFEFIVDGPHLSLAGTTELSAGHMRIIIASKDDAVVGAKGKIRVELRPPASTTLSDELTYEIVAPPPVKEKTSTVNLPEIRIYPVTSVDDGTWVELDWPEDVSEVAAEYTPQEKENRILVHYSTLFPKYRAAYQQLAVKDLAKAESFQKRFEIWLVTSVLIHWQDTRDDKTPIAGEDIDPDKLADYKRDELRRAAQAAIIYAQREVATLGDSATSGDE